MFRTFYVFALLLLVMVVRGKDLFKCAKIFECSNRPCELVKTVNSVKSLDNTILQEEVDEIHVMPSNSVGVLSKGSVRNLLNLERLRLANVKITTIEPGAFENLPNLELIDLRKNELETVSEGIFNKLNVTEIYLQNNKITFIEEGAFDDMLYLEIIKLDNNRIRKINGNWFRNSPNIHDISIKQNKLITIPAKSFRNVKGTHVAHDGEIVETNIYLTKNKIRSIHPRAFDGLEALGDLYLNQNKLQILDRRIFTGLRSISELNLSKNKIKILSDDLLPTSINVEILDLTHNKLKCLPFEIANKVNATYLENNKLDCDCLEGLKEQLSVTNNTNTIEYEKRDCKVKKKKKKKPKKKKKKRKQNSDTL